MHAEAEYGGRASGFPTCASLLGGFGQVLETL